MKYREYLIGSVTVVALIAVIWWLGFNDHGSEHSASAAPTVDTPSASPISGSPNQPSPPATTAPMASPAPIDDSVNPKVTAIRAIVDSENSKSLDFYGKIIDQYGNPVAGVKIKAGIGLIVSFTRSGGEDLYVESDSEGKFSFVGIHGAGVGFFLEKEGYVYDQKLPSTSRPNDYVPDPNNPVIFTMWKLKGAEPMIHTTIQAGLACDGKSRNFDLLTSRRDAGGLTATLMRNPVNIDRSKPFDWTLTLSMSGGGLIEITDLYPNEAPASGYQTVTINMHADAKNWTPSVVQSYYFYDGQHYGRVTVNIMANYQPPPTHVEFEAFVNPSGSRNLEYDPNNTAPTNP